MNLEIAYRLARTKLDEHGLQQWDIMFDVAKLRFGRCYYKTHLITLSRILVGLNNEAEILDTILHEIAHALVGREHRHDRIWKQKARDIGCNGKRCYGQGVIRPVAKYSAICTRCSSVYRRQRRVSELPHKFYICSVCNRQGQKVKLHFATAVLQAGMTKVIAS